MLASAVVILSWDSHLTFVADDWMLLVKRHGWGADYFLKPFHGSIILAPAIIFRAIRETIGMSSAMPYYIVSIGMFVAGAALLYFYLRSRIPDWLALLAAVLILFLGAAFEDLLFAFQVGYFGSVAAGLGMLIALDREDDRGDVIACVLLMCSLAFSSVGIAFAAGAVVDLLLSGRPRGRRAYVALGPIALYGLWWLGWGHQDENNLSVHNVLSAPEYAFRSASAGVTSLLGLASNDGSEPEQPHLIWGKLLVCLGLALLAVRTIRARGISRHLAVALAIGVSFWVLAAFNYDLTREATSSRYQYPSAMFVLLIAAELVRGIRIPRLVAVPAAIGVALASSGGMSLMHSEYSERWVTSSNALRSTLAAAEIARPAADPTFRFGFPPDITAPVGDYLGVSAQHGTPAYSEAELAERAQAEREYADVTLSQVLGLALVHPQPNSRALQCQTLEASSTGATGVTLLHGVFTFANRSATPIELRLGRFAEGFPVGFGAVPPQGTAQLTIPIDTSERPWALGLIGSGRVRLCITEAR